MNTPNSAAPVSRYPVPTLENLPEDIRARILEVQSKAGFVPNVFLALAHRPAEWRAFVAYHDALMLKEGGHLSKGDREVAINWRKADITPRQRAMLAFAMKVCQRSSEVDDADFAALREHGFDEEDAWDIAAITAFFGMSNRLANATGMKPNDEFYLMGRVPKVK
jgi:alkylhydroperoxidase family enzyme